MMTWILVLALLSAAPLRAVKLTAETVEAFQKYVERNDQRVEAELRHGEPYLWIDAQPEKRRRSLLAQLQQGQTLLEEVKAGGAEVPRGMIHHWTGLAFTAGVTLEQTVALMMDYDNYQVFHRPYIARSKIIRREGNDTAIYLQLYSKKAFTTSVVDTELQVHYVPLGSTRGHSRTHSTLVAEVQNERRLHEGDDRGYLWRLVSYWRFLERDGGTYLQCEGVSLSRDLPAGSGWIVGPFLKGVHKDFVRDLVSNSRAALLARHGAGPR